MSLPELARRGYPDLMSVGSLAGAGTLGLLIPPSIIMIVYGVMANVSIAELFIAGVVPGVLLASLFSGYVVVWALLHSSGPPAAQTAGPWAIAVSAVLSLLVGYACLATFSRGVYLAVPLSLSLLFLRSVPHRPQAG